MANVSVAVLYWRSRRGSFLDKMVKLLYYLGMATKNDKIESVICQLRRVLSKYSRVEHMPIQLASGTKLTTREVHTIEAVGKGKSMNVTNVAAHFGVTKSAASQMVAKLTSKGFLRKRVALHSNKEYTLSLTRAGQEAFDTHRQLHGKGKKMLVASLNKFSLSQLEVMPDLLSAFEAVADRRLGE